MALPIGKQPEAQPEHSGNNADLRSIFLDSISKRRHVYDRDSEHPFIRGRGRNAHMRAWLLWEDQESPANASARDHLLRGAPFHGSGGHSGFFKPELFPNYPWNGMQLFERHGLERDTYYLSKAHISRSYDGLLNSVMPLDAIQVQLHQHAVKIVWAHGAADKYDLRRKAFALERSLTADEWVSFARDSNALIKRLVNLVPSLGQQRISLMAGIIRSFSGSIRLTISQIESGIEPFHQTLGEAVKRLYTFQETEPTKTWNSYQDFLNSPEWQAKRKAVRKRSGGWCESCRVAGVLKRAVHVHHVHYEKAWGQEETSDLLHLCEDHHRLAHGNVP